MEWLPGNEQALRRLSQSDKFKLGPEAYLAMPSCYQYQYLRVVGAHRHESCGTCGSSVLIRASAPSLPILCWDCVEDEFPGFILDYTGLDFSVPPTQQWAMDHSRTHYDNR